ncbi:MAG: short-chain dehydrogenase/reductase [Frankiales bacterium]|nr:short-chain dehydrogenase/reductase [Frankiales bacterium]
MKLQAGRVALITGGASGIGLALATAAGQAGLTVLVADLDETRLAEAAAQLRGLGVRVETAAGDVSDAEFVASLAELAFALGSVQLVCSNAGIVVPGLSWEISAADWEKVIGVDLMASVHLLRAFVPRLISAAEPAHLLITGSMASVTARAGIAPYVSAKHGLLGLAETAAAELKSVGAEIGVTILMPGQVVSGMITEANAHTISSEQAAAIALQAVAHDQLYAFTHPDRIPEVERRFAAIVASEIRTH